MDSNSGQLKKPPSVVKIIKTALPQTATVFNFSENDIQAAQVESEQNITENIIEARLNNNPLAKTPLTLKIIKDPIGISSESSSTPLNLKSPSEMKRPRLKLKTMASIVQLGCRYSSINEEDLKTTIKKLRTPTLEKSQFCFSPVRELPPRSSLAFSPTSLKTNMFYWEPKSSTIHSAVEDKICEEVDENIEDKQQELQKPLESSNEQNVMESQSEISDNLNNQNKVADEAVAKQNKLKELNLKSENSKIDLCENAYLPLNADNDKVNETILKPNFSQRLVNKLENKFRSLSPFSSTIQVTDEKLSESLINKDMENSIKSEDMEKSTRSEDMEKSTSSLNENIIKNINHRSEKALAETSNVPIPSIRVKANETIEQQSIPKKNSSKGFVNRLQSKLRALSPLTLRHGQEANFQSYVNFKNNNDNIKETKPKQQDKNKINLKNDFNNLAKQDVKLSRKPSITKDNILHSNNSFGSLQKLTPHYTSQQRLPRQSLRSSISSSKSNINFPNTVQRRSSTASFSSSTNLQARRLSLQTNEKVSKTQGVQNELKSSKGLNQRRVSLPLSHVSATASNPLERRKSIGKTSENNTITKTLSKKDNPASKTKSLTSNVKTNANPTTAKSSQPKDRKSIQKTSTNFNTPLCKRDSLKTNNKFSTSSNTGSNSLLRRDSLHSGSPSKSLNLAQRRKSIGTPLVSSLSTSKEKNITSSNPTVRRKSTETNQSSKKEKILTTSNPNEGEKSNGTSVSNSLSKNISFKNEKTFKTTAFDSSQRRSSLPCNATTTNTGRKANTSTTGSSNRRNSIGKSYISKPASKNATLPKRAFVAEQNIKRPCKK